MLNGIPPVVPRAMRRYDSRRITKGLTIGSSDRGSVVFDELRRESMIRINQLRFASAQPRVAQPHR